MAMHKQKRELSEYNAIQDAVLFTRIRLARNLPGIPFPHAQSIEDSEAVISAFEKFVSLQNHSECTFVRINSLDSLEKRFLREQSLISAEMEFSNKSAVLYSKVGDFAVQINGDDHICIQVTKTGLVLPAVLERANEIDDEINSCCSYAFSPNLGYLTACPSNLGTGLYSGIMMHLPALTAKKAIPSVSQKLRNAGATLSGSIGSTGKSPGCIYVISNKPFLGVSETDITERMDSIIASVVNAEDGARDSLLSSSKLETQDSVLRSYGLLKYACKMSYIEALEHLSNMRLGIILGLLNIKDINLKTIDSLMLNCQWVHLQKMSGRIFQTSEEGDKVRAEVLRGVFNSSFNENLTSAVIGGALDLTCNAPEKKRKIKGGKKDV